MVTLSQSAIVRQPSFILPESFDPRELGIPPERFDDVRHLVSLVMVKTAHGEVDEFGSVRLQAKFLDDVMDSRYRADIVRRMVACGMLQPPLPYKVHCRSYGYRLGERYIADSHVRCVPTNPTLIRRLHRVRKEIERKRVEGLRPIHREIAKRQEMLSVDHQQATALLKRIPPESNQFDAQGVLIGDIERRDFRLTVSETGRIFNSITSLRRDLRKALRFGREPLVAVDVRCAQPALLAGMLAREERIWGSVRSADKGAGREERKGGRGEGRRVSLNDSNLVRPFEADSRLFRELASSGELYDFLETELRKVGPQFDRDAVKQKFCCDVLAKKKANAAGAEYPSAFEDFFASRFPDTYRFIRAFNHDGYEHANLIRRLQQEEAKLIIDTVMVDLLQRFPATPFITIHDSIYSTPSNVGRIQKAFWRAFEQLGFSAALKVVET